VRLNCEFPRVGGRALKRDPTMTSGQHHVLLKEKSYNNKRDCDRYKGRKKGGTCPGGTSVASRKRGIEKQGKGKG